MSVWGTLASRGVVIPPLCFRCSHLVESLFHALRDCPNSVSFWNNISPPSSCLPSFLLPFLEWLSLNCMSSISHSHSHILWQTIFSFGLWNLWLRKNHVVFKLEVALLGLVIDTISFATEFFCLVSKSKPTKRLLLIPVKWLLPSSG